MRADELDHYAIPWAVGDTGDDPEFVAADIEDDAVVSKKSVLETVAKEPEGFPPAVNPNSDVQLD